MLLAASQTGGGGGGTYDDIFGEIPPESTEFGWPLYITIPFKEDHFHGDIFGKIYYLESNEITQQLLQWCIDNNVEEGTLWMPEYWAYPPELYINGMLVKNVVAVDTTDSWDASTSFSTEEFYLQWITLFNDGSMEIYLMKNENLY